MTARIAPVRFHMFGDESTNGEIVAYGVVIVLTQREADLHEQLRASKTAFRGPADAVIHCKDLLHGDQRGKSPWSHLSSDGAFALLEDAMRRTRATGARAWIGYLDRRGAPDVMLFEGGDTKKITSLHLTMFAYWAAMGPVHDIVPREVTRAWMDPNKDRLQLVGKGNAQFRLSQGFFPVNHNDVRFEPERVEVAKPPLLELADVVAHCGARALSQAKPTGKERHEAVLSQIRPGLSYVEFNVGSGPVCSVRANTAAVTELRADLAGYR